MADLIKVDFSEPPVLKRVNTNVPCRHTRTAVDAQAREVVCRDCGASLDPIQVLDALAGAYRMRDRRINELRELEARQAEREAERKRVATDRAKHRLRIVARPEDAPAGDNVCEVTVVCRHSGERRNFFVAFRGNWNAVQNNHAVLELLAPQLFAVFGWSALWMAKGSHG